MLETESMETKLEDCIPVSLSSWMKENDVPAMCDVHTIASIGGHLNLQRRIEREPKEVSMKNSKGWTPLMYACYNGCGKTIQLLVDSGASKKDRNEKSQTAVMIAAHFGNCEALHFFPEKIHLDCEDDKGWTALFYAVAAGHHTAVDILLTNGSNVNKVDKYNGFTVTMIAAMTGNDSLMELLLSKGADPNIKSSEGYTAISIAISKGNNNLIQILGKYWPKEKKTRLPRELIDGNTIKLHHQNSKESQSSSNVCCLSNQILLSGVKKINLNAVLRHHNMEKYCSMFEEQNIELESFLNLTEEDLKKLGIKLFGPRRKMSLLINHWNSCDICQTLCSSNF